jgi:hypothetical protein
MDPRKPKLFLVVEIALLFFVVFGLYEFFSGEPIPVDQYHAVKVSNHSCQGYGDRKSRRIIIDASDKRYIFFYGEFVGREYTEQDIIDKLCSSKELTIWTESESKKVVDVKGISSEFFRVDPQLGYERAKANRNASLWLAIMFFALWVLFKISIRRMLK